MKLDRQVRRLARLAGREQAHKVTRRALKQGKEPGRAARRRIRTRPS